MLQGGGQQRLQGRAADVQLDSLVGDPEGALGPGAGLDLHGGLESAHMLDVGPGATAQGVLPGRCALDRRLESASVARASIPRR